MEQVKQLPLFGPNENKFLKDKGKLQKPMNRQKDMLPIEPPLGGNEQNSRSYPNNKHGTSEKQPSKNEFSRQESKEIHKELVSAINKHVGNKVFGPAIGRIYTGLYHKNTIQLKEMYQTQSIRDNLPPLHLQFLKTAEMTIADELNRQGKMTSTDLMDLIDKVAKPLGQILSGRN